MKFKNFIVLSLTMAVVLFFSYISPISADHGNPGEDGNGNNSFTTNSGYGSGGPMSSTELYSIGGYVGVKFSLVNKNTMAVPAIYYLFGVHPNSGGSDSVAFFRDSSNPSAYGYYNLAGKRAVCGLMEGSGSGAYTTDKCVQLPDYSTNGKVSGLPYNVKGVEYGIKNGVYAYGNNNFDLSAEALGNFMRDGKDTTTDPAKKFQGKIYFHLYDFLATKLDVCSLPEFELSSAACANAQSLYVAFDKIDKQNNKGLNNYIVIAEPIYSFRQANQPTHRVFVTLKGLSRNIYNRALSDPNYKSSNTYGYSPYSNDTRVDGIHDIFYSLYTHGLVKPYDNIFESQKSGKMTADKWLRLSDPHIGNNYYIWYLSAVAAETNNSCTKLDSNDDGVYEKYYGVNRNEVSKDQWLKECTCKFTGSSYIDREGKEVSSVEEYKKSCTCVEDGGNYYITYPNPVKKEEYDKSCNLVCAEKDGVYYDYNGKEVKDLDTLKKSCMCVPTKTDRNSYYLVIGDSLDNIKLLTVPKNSTEYTENCGNMCVLVDDVFYDVNRNAVPKSEYEANIDKYNSECTCVGPREDGLCYTSLSEEGMDCSSKEYLDYCNPICTVSSKDGNYYDVNGNAIDSKVYEDNKEEYDEKCKCAKVDGKCYVDYSSGVSYDCNEEGTPYANECWNPICEYDPIEDVYYGKNREKLNSSIQFEKECKCVKDDNKCYINYPEEVSCTSNEWKDECEKETVCTNTEKNYYGEKEGTEFPKTCSKDSNNIGTMEDPSVCSILNTNNNNYLTSYGNNYCKIYCREKLQFTFMDKETAIAGMSFKHKLKSKYDSSLSGNLSLVILSTRQCTSVINYDDWKDRYKQVNYELTSSWENLKYWEAIYNGTGGGQVTNVVGHDDDCSYCSGNGRTYCARGNSNWKYEWTGDFSYRSCNYDKEGNVTSCRTVNASGGSISNTGASGRVTLYRTRDSWPNPNYQSCLASANADPDDNLYPSSCKSTLYGPYYCYSGSTTNYGSANSNYVKSNYNQAVKNYKDALDAREKLLYQIQDCNMLTTKTNLPSYDKSEIVTYKKSSRYVSNGSTYTPTANFSVYDQVVDSNAKDKVEVDYYDNKEGYDIHELEHDYTNPIVTEANFSTDSKWKDYCVNCDGDLSNLGSTTNDKVPYFICSGSGTNATCTEGLVTVPSNKIANLKFEQESLYYQGDDFYTEVYSGAVSKEANNSNGSYWMRMNRYSWPVAIDRETGDYEITVKYKDLGINLSSFPAGNFTCYYHVVNDLANYNCKDGEYNHVCYECDGDSCLGGDNSQSTKGLGVYFRTVDLSDIFPNSIYSPEGTNSNKTRRVGYNWQNATAVITEIQNTTNVIIDKEPQYSITLTPRVINGIKEYNKANSYLNNSVICNSELRCASTFLSDGGDLDQIMARYGDEYGIRYRKDSSVPYDSLFYYRR